MKTISHWSSERFIWIPFLFLFVNNYGSSDIARLQQRLLPWVSHIFWCGNSLLSIKKKQCNLGFWFLCISPVKKSLHEIAMVQKGFGVNTEHLFLTQALSLTYLTSSEGLKSHQMEELGNVSYLGRLRKEHWGQKPFWLYWSPA